MPAVEPFRLGIEPETSALIVSLRCRARTRVKRHRRTVPLEGVRSGFHQLQLTLTVSPTGEVLNCDAGGDPETLSFWPQLRGEVLQWRFLPFEKDGNAITAQVKEFLDLGK